MNGKVSYESILARMLASAPGGVDVGEGSIFYDAVVPAAKELAAMYERLDDVMNDAFPDTCGEEALLRHAESLGVKRKAATCAVVSARVNKKLPGGSRSLLGRHVYVLGDYIDEYTIGRYRYRLVCETAGSEANLDVGEALLPLSYIEGLTFCECERLLEAGRDEEDIESLRRRVVEARISPRSFGSLDDYRRVVSGIVGVGGVKVTPRASGAGTVRVAVRGDDGAAPSAEVLDEVKRVIADEIAQLGQGVTVAGAVEKKADIAVTVVYADGVDAAAGKEAVGRACGEFVAAAASTWESTVAVVMRISQLTARIYDTEVVKSVTSASINGSATDVTLGADEIPTLGTVTIS